MESRIRRQTPVSRRFAAERLLRQRLGQHRRRSAKSFGGDGFARVPIPKFASFSGTHSRHWRVSMFSLLDLVEFLVQPVWIVTIPGVTMPTFASAGRGRGQAADNAQGRRGLVHPAQNESTRRRTSAAATRRSSARRRKREAARRAGQVSAVRRVVCAVDCGTVVNPETGESEMRTSEPKPHSLR
jgi:hypothetical protein